MPSKALCGEGRDAPVVPQASSLPWGSALRAGGPFVGSVGTAERDVSGTTARRAPATFPLHGHPSRGGHPPAAIRAQGARRPVVFVVSLISRSSFRQHAGVRPLQRPPRSRRDRTPHPPLLPGERDRVKVTVFASSFPRFVALLLRRFVALLLLRFVALLLRRFVALSLRGLVAQDRSASAIPSTNPFAVLSRELLATAATAFCAAA
jgi:hypothetical protein